MVTLNPVSRSVALLLVGLTKTKHITEFPPYVTIYPGVQTQEILDLINKIAQAQESGYHNNVVHLLKDIDENLARKYAKLHKEGVSMVESTEVNTSNQTKKTKKDNKNKSLLNKALRLQNKRLETELNKNQNNLEAAKKENVLKEKKLKTRKRAVELLKLGLEIAKRELEHLKKKLDKSQQKLEMVQTENINLKHFKDQNLKKNNELNKDIEACKKEHNKVIVAYKNAKEKLRNQKEELQNNYTGFTELEEILRRYDADVQELNKEFKEIVKSK